MRVFLHTFGCKANQYDSERLRQAVEDAGAVVVDDDVSGVDAAILNSCTVTHAAEAKMRGLVRRIARAAAGARTVVTGCAAAVDDGTIGRLPGVAGVVSGADPARVLGLLGLATPAPGAPLRRFAQEGRGWLRIQDGCDEHCTFCATTLARGASRSRRMEDIAAEARALSASHAELVLTGVHIGAYGADLEPAGSLGTLAERLVRDVPGVRFRLSSVEATEVDDRLADLLAAVPESLAPHLHAPLQSGSDRLLRRMGRHWYTSATYRARVEGLAARLPVFGLGADIIVGFPGETEADHRATRDLVEALPFTYLHVFPYSARPGTAAPRLGRATPGPVAARRAAELRDLASRKAAAHAAARVGQPADVVVSGRSHGRYQGVTGDYLTVSLPAAVPAAPRFRATLRLTAGTLSAEAA